MMCSCCHAAFEAMYGTSPAAVEKNLKTYCIYYSSPVPFKIDQKTQRPVKTTTREVATKAKNYAVIVVLTALCFSVMIPTAFAPFPSPRTTGQPVSSLYDLLDHGHLLNNYSVACKRVLAE